MRCPNCGCGELREEWMGPVVKYLTCTNCGIKYAYGIISLDVGDVKVEVDPDEHFEIPVNGFSVTIEINTESGECESYESIKPNVKDVIDFLMSGNDEL